MSQQLNHIVKKYLYADGQNSDDNVFHTLYNTPHYDIADSIHAQNPELNYDDIVNTLDELENTFYEKV